MKKNFTKKLALGLALVMTVGSVNMPVAAEAASNPGFKSEKATVEVGKTKKYGTENASKWSFYKAKIGNKAVATVKLSKKGKFVKVTGVSEGETRVRAYFKNYKTKEVYKDALLPVTVTAAKEETPAVTTAELASVKQTAANAFEATFTADASKTVTAESFTSIESSDSIYSAYAKTVSFSADGLTAKIETYGNFTDGVTYNVTCAEKTASFTASVGAVKTAVVNTVKAQQNVETDIEFTLYDANGIDVTNAIKVDTYVSIDVDGDADYNVKKPSKATILMDTVGDKATVTVTYDALDGSDEVVAKGEITCISAQATVGSKTVFTKATSSPKVYLKSFEVDNVIYNEDDKIFTFYFAALDKDGFAIEYDEYEVESANEDIVVVDDYDTEGKALKITVGAARVGTTKLVIKATKNEVETLYSETIVVKPERELKNITFSAKTITVSNDAKHFDDRVYVYFEDQYGNRFYDADSDAGLTNEKLNDNDYFTYTHDDGKHYGVIDIHAQNVLDTDEKKDTVVIEIEASDDNDNEKRNKVSVTIKKPTTDEVTYKVQLTDNSVDLNPEIRVKKDNVGGNVTARLASYKGSVFAGYVNPTKVTIQRGSQYSKSLDLSNEKNFGAGVQDLSGSYVKAVNAGDIPKGITVTTAAITTSAIHSDINGSVMLIPGEGVAKTGNYKVVMTATDSKEYKATFDVKNSMEDPTVKVVASTDDEAATGLELAKACITVDVDALVGPNSIKYIFGKDGNTYKDISTESSGDVDVRRIWVVDTFYGQKYTYQINVKANLDLD